MSTKFEALFGIKESVSQEEIDDLKNYRGEKHKLFQILNRRFEYMYKNIDSNKFDELQGILYNVCKDINSLKRNELLKSDDPLKPFQHKHILNLYKRLMEEGSASTAADLALLPTEKAEWLEHQLKELYANNSKEVADSLSYDLYDMIFSDNEYVTRLKEPFAFFKNKELLDFFNKLNFNPELQTAFLLLSDEDKFACYKQFLKKVNDLNKNPESQNNTDSIDALLQSIKQFHNDNALKPLFRDKVSKNFYYELSNDFSRKQFLELSDDMRDDITKLPISIARNLLNTTAKNKKLFRILMIMEDFVRHKDSSKSILETLPEQYYHVFATNKDFRKDYINNLFDKVDTKEAAETKQSFDAQAKKQKEDELKKIDKDNRDALRKASDDYSKQQYHNQSDILQQEQPNTFKKLQDIDSHVNGFIDTFYEYDKHVREFIADIPTNDILDVCELCNNNITKIFVLLSKLFKLNVKPATLLRLPEEIKQFCFDNTHTISDIVSCIKQQEAYGIPSKGESPNTNKFVNRYIQLYKSNDKTLADKYSKIPTEDKLTLESFIRDYSKSQKLGSEIIRFLNSNQEERDAFEFNDTPSVSKTTKNSDKQNKIIEPSDYSLNVKLSDLFDAHANDLSKLIKVAKETDKLEFIYKRSNKESDSTNPFDAILAILGSLPAEESTEFFNTLSNQLDNYRFYKATLFLILTNSKARAFILHNCTDEDAAALCQLEEPKDNNEDVCKTINKIVDEVVAENEGKIIFSFRKVEQDLNVPSDSLKEDKEDEKNQEQQNTNKIKFNNFVDSIKSLFCNKDKNNDNLYILNKEININDVLSKHQTIEDLISYIVKSINNALENYKTDTASISEQSLESFKDNILKVKQTLENAQKKIDEIYYLKRNDTNDSSKEKIKDLSNEVYQLTQSIKNELGDSSYYNPSEDKSNENLWNTFSTRIDQFKSVNKNILSKIPNDFINLDKLQKKILNTSVAKTKTGHIDFTQEIENCDKFYQLAKDGFLDDLGIQIYMFKVNLHTIINDICEKINNINNHKIEQYKIELDEYLKNNSNITSFDTFKRSKAKPQMPKLINESEIKDKINGYLSSIDNILQKYTADISDFKKQYIETFNNEVSNLIEINNEILQRKIYDVNTLKDFKINEMLQDIIKQYKDKKSNLFEEFKSEVNGIKLTLNAENITEFDKEIQLINKNPLSTITTFNNEIEIKSREIESTAKKEDEMFKNALLSKSSIYKQISNNYNPNNYRNIKDEQFQIICEPLTIIDDVSAELFNFYNQRKTLKKPLDSATLEQLHSFINDFTQNIIKRFNLI